MHNLVYIMHIAKFILVVGLLNCLSLLIENVRAYMVAPTYIDGKAMYSHVLSLENQSSDLTGSVI